MKKNKKVLITILSLLIIISIFGIPPFTGNPSYKNYFTDGYTDFETGVKRNLNGIYEVSAITPMPGVKPEMVEWWFKDYIKTTQHYKSWHPTAHVWMNWENKIDGELIGASHLVHEYIGNDLSKFRIQFVDYKEIFGDIKLFENEIIICARVGLLEEPLNMGRMCHLVRKTQFGCEMRSRFWLGYVSKRDGNNESFSIQGLLANTYIARLFLVNKSSSIDLMQHAIEEMSNLASFLPKLYENEK